MPVAEFTESQLVAWGEEFGRMLAMPAFVVLYGELGAGKTTLVRAIARAQGMLEPVTSPTYGLMHEYHSPRGHIYHLDLYRLRMQEELYQIGWEEVLGSQGLVLVEWPDRAGDALPPSCIELRLEHVEGRPALRRLTWS